MKSWIRYSTLPNCATSPDKSSTWTVACGNDRTRMTSYLHRTFQYPGCVVTGTDTAVGKTLVTAALGLALKRAGVHLGIMKPIETGTAPKAASLPHPSDSERLRVLLTPDESPERVAPYRLPLPLAPLAAARMLGLCLEMSNLDTAYQQLRSRYEYLLVEGIGGVYVPISNRERVCDLIVRFKLPCIVVSRAALGSINHTLLTLAALHQAHVPVLAVVLNQTQPFENPSDQQLQLDSTVQLLQEHCSIPVFGPLPYCPYLHEHWGAGVAALATSPVIAQLIKVL
ncbi:MAG: dethiobiotin synthase [Nitrospirae bacterium]|nr:MAG: dethiobiotin synthase [Nitrospirota bacterium]